MFATVTCPACRHKFSIPEGAMGNRQTCPNCHSPFMAGKSVAEADAPIPMRFQAVATPATNKTMLGEIEPPIRYNCPRCKKPLEAPAIEAGTKKPCPECGQRLQVPAPVAAPLPNLNKTMLAGNEGNDIRTTYPAGQPGPGVGAPPTPVATVGTGQTGAPALWPQSIAGRAGVIAGIVIGAIVILSLVTGPSRADLEKYANAQKEVERLKAEIEQSKTMMEKQKQFEAEQLRRWDNLMAENKSKQRELELQRQLDRDNELYRNNEKLAAQVREKREQEQRALDAANLAAAQERQKAELAFKQQIDALKAQVDAAAQRQTTIIQAAPPVYYPWHPRYYWGY